MVDDENLIEKALFFVFYKNFIRYWTTSSLLVFIHMCILQVLI